MVLQEAEQEIEQVVGRILGDYRRGGRLDLEASETAVRAVMHKVGGSLLEKLLNAELGYRGAKVDCSKGHHAKFIQYRSKQLVTVLSDVSIERAYYYCAKCGSGVIPKDEELDITGTSFSPGVRRMMGRVGGKEPFDEGRRDLEELAGIAVKTKEVERTSEAIGDRIERLSGQERELIKSGKVMPMGGATIPILYVAMDATSVPVVPREVEGRRGKGEDGKAKSRESKLGCVFTQTTEDEKGRPVRDADSTSYVGAIETASEFGWRIYAEALRRGLARALRVVVLGDGAPWIWVLAALHFPGAIQIVDLFHALEHLSKLAKLLYGQGSKKAKRMTEMWSAKLKEGDVESVITSLKRLRPLEVTASDAVAREIAYFLTNAERMRYGDFRRAGLFVGSGVVEAGCKTVIGHRLKQSGMHWTVRGANSIIWLRCCQMSGRWEEYWEASAIA